MKEIIITFLFTLCILDTVNSENPFSKAKHLLNNLEKDVHNEKTEADKRNDHEVQKCQLQIESGMKKKEEREKIDKETKDKIVSIESKLSSKANKKETKENRLKENIFLLIKLKEQRCEKNLLFINQLRKHIEGIDLLHIVKQDIIDYFDVKKPSLNGPGAPKRISPEIIEKLSEVFSLLNKTNKGRLMLLQTTLKTLQRDHGNANDYSQEDKRGAKSINYDNNIKGEIDKIDEFNSKYLIDSDGKSKYKVLPLIEDLIYDLKDSRREIEKKEMKSAEDYVIIQINTEKENNNLIESVKTLTKLIEKLQAKLLIANEAMSNYDELLKNAIEEFEVINSRCNRINDYYQNETRRRNNELETLNTAQEIFDRIMKNISDKVKDQVSNLISHHSIPNEHQS